MRHTQTAKESICPYLIGENVKSKIRIITLATLLPVLASISCSLFIRPEPTPEPDPYYFVPVTDPLVFEPETLSVAQVGVMYEAEIHITGNVTPVSDFFISKGSLPIGLEFVKVESEDTAKISGIPEETGTFTFTVDAWCFGTMVPGQIGQMEYAIVVEK